MAERKVKPKKCKAPGCSNKFNPYLSTQVVCSPKCAAIYARAKNEQKMRKDTLERKKALKTRSDWIKDAQKAVNEYVRLRDEKEGCISCDKPFNSVANQWDAGHYRSIGSAPHLRFYTLNNFKQCKRCNRELSGNAIEYRKRLVLRFGSDRVESLDNLQFDLKPDIDYLQRLTGLMRKKIRLYKKLFR